MNFKDLNITSTSLFKPLFREYISSGDDQYNCTLLPFQVNDEVYLIDTYHINDYHYYYEDYVESLIKGGSRIYKCVPFVNDFYYKHAYKVNSVEELHNKFELICDLKDYVACKELDFYDYVEEDKIMVKALKYDGRRTYLIKKGAKKDMSTQINNLTTRIAKAITEVKPYVYSMYDMDELKRLIKENPDCNYDKKMYNKTLEWYNYMCEISEEINKKYREIFRATSAEN